MRNTTRLEEIADVGLGYKSLQNDFYYLTRETAKTFQIERRFLSPIYMLGDLAAESFAQLGPAELLLFACVDDERDLRGTGAWRYIRTMSERPATAKKQAGQSRTISEVLSSQSGRLWYGPKAQPRPARLWLRKGVGGVFAPFIFQTPQVVDQRCNYVVAKDGITEEELAAVLTSTCFAFSAEVNGSTSMGAGVIELATSKLKGYPVPDVRLWSSRDRASLVKLATSVWTQEEPVDWTRSKPGPNLTALDQHVLKRLNPSVSADRLYADMKALVQARYRLAADKTGKQKKKHSESIGSVVEGVVNRLRPILEAAHFPESFVAPGQDMEHIEVEGATLVRASPMMGNCDVEVLGVNGTSLLSISSPQPVAAVVMKALLLGRRNFAFPTEEAAALGVIDRSQAWLDRLGDRLSELVAESTAGSGYELPVAIQVRKTLGINAVAFEREIPLQADL